MNISSAHKKRLANVVRFVAAVAMVVSSFGVAAASPVSADRLSQVSATLSDTRPGQPNARYTVSFNPTLATPIQQVQLKVCGNSGSWSDTCDDPTDDGDGGTNGAAFSTASASITGFGDGGAAHQTLDMAETTVSGNIITIALEEFDPEDRSDEGSSTHSIILPGQTNALQSQTYYIRIRTYSDDGVTMIDSGQAAFALVAPVQLSGQVLESMTFTVAAVTSGSCGTGGPAITSTTATATSIPFGNYQSGTPRVACHTVATDTNANNGYTTKVQTVNPGVAPQGAMCRQTATTCSTVGASSTATPSDYIADVGLSTTAAEWTPGSTFGLGVNANGGRAIAGAPGFNGLANMYKQVVGTNGVVLSSHSGPDAADNSRTHVVYRTDVTPTQTAGVYQNQLEYVSTPTF